MVERSPSMRSPDFNTQEYNTTPHKFTHVHEQISDIIAALVSSRVLGTDHMTARERLENSLSSREQLRLVLFEPTSSIQLQM